MDATRLNHASGSTAILWDSLANIATNWTTSASIGSTSYVYEAGGGMGDFANVSAGLTQYAGAQRIGPVNWSAYTQLRMSIYMNVSASAAFNISAFDSALHPQTTVAVPLSSGWQTVTLDLGQLGPFRGSLTAVTLRVVGIGGQKLPPLKLYFAGIQVGAAKLADTTARVSQVFSKDNGTTALPGSAYLSFDWNIENQTGVAAYRFGANLTGPTGTFVTVMPPGFSLGWRHFTTDVSPYVTEKGDYNLSFGLQVVLDNITASNVTAYVDNVVFTYPNRGNGTYESRVMTFGANSRYLSVTWSATAPSPVTSVLLGFRTGSTGSALGTWHEFSTPGTYGLSDVGVYFQIRVVLNTTNASVSPALMTLSLAGTHRTGQGVVLSATYAAPTDFLVWRSFNAIVAVNQVTSVSFWVGNGSYWHNVTPGSNLSFLVGSRLAWRAVLTSSDGLVTPSLERVQIVYDFLGAPVSIAISPGGPLNVTQGESITFSTRILDEGDHVVPYASVTWTTTDPSGHVDNNGKYTAGSVGDYRVNATVSGMVSVTRSVVVHVAPGVQSSSGFPWGLWPYMLLVVAAAVAGFGAYQIFIVRMFAIDDVFLIAKDGRLMIHNTRRMRADRDEDILSGMLTAIMAFLRDQDPEENGELKRFEVGGKTTLLERGEHVYLSAIYSGRVPGWAGKDLHRFMTDLEAKFGDAFAKWSGSPEELHDLKEYMQRFVSHVRYHRGPRGRGGEN